MRREKHNLSMLTFPSAPTTCGPQPQTTGLVSASSESQPSSSEARTQLLAFSQISAHASGTWRHPHSLASILSGIFYFDISESHILSARAWTPALMSALTNPWAKRKVLSLIKPKGKIYKTKSLRNYITKIPLGLNSNTTERYTSLGRIPTA